MTPTQEELTQDIQDQNALDEKACAERIDYWLKKYGCALDGQAIIRNGFTQIQIGVVKLSPEARKQMKEAAKHGKSTIISAGSPEAGAR